MPTYYKNYRLPHKTFVNTDHTKTTQKPHKNHTKTTQKPHKSHTKATQKNTFEEKHSRKQKFCGKFKVNPRKFCGKNKFSPGQKWQDSSVGRHFAKWLNEQSVGKYTSQRGGDREQGQERANRQHLTEVKKKALFCP
jgi:hypothetical protein